MKQGHSHSLAVGLFVALACLQCQPGNEALLYPPAIHRPAAAAAHDDDDDDHGRVDDHRRWSHHFLCILGGLLLIDL